jgi:hypothetical protein
MIVFGLGIQDTAVDVFMLLYRILPPESNGAKYVVRGLGVFQQCTRALEWTMLGGDHFMQRGEVSRLMGIWDIMPWGLLLVGWILTEFDDWVKLRTMWRKFERNVNEKRD